MEYKRLVEINRLADQAVYSDNFLHALAQLQPGQTIHLVGFANSTETGEHVFFNFFMEFEDSYDYPNAKVIVTRNPDGDILMNFSLRKRNGVVLHKLTSQPLMRIGNDVYQYEVLCEVVLKTPLDDEVIRLLSEPVVGGRMVRPEWKLPPCVLNTEFVERGNPAKYEPLVRAAVEGSTNEHVEARLSVRTILAGDFRGVLDFAGRLRLILMQGGLNRDTATRSLKYL